MYLLPNKSLHTIYRRSVKALLQNSVEGANQLNLKFITIMCVMLLFGAILLCLITRSKCEAVTTSEECIQNGKSEQRIMEPTTEYEQLRRRIRSNIEVFGNYVSSELKKIEKQKPALREHIDKITKMVNERKSALINDMDNLKKNDGYEQWRYIEHEQLSDMVQRRLKYLQNPKNCGTAKKLICRLHLHGRGYGSLMHHLIYCFIMAYATERTLILNSTEWCYNKNGWEEVFQPFSDTCTTPDGNSRADWSKRQNETQVVDLPEFMNPRPPQFPLAIPDDLASRLTRLHGSPIAWWLGQLFKYFLRFQPKTQAIIDETIRKIGFKTPIVGVHIRRSDKVTTKEANAYNVEEYMKHVDEYYNRLEMVEQVEKRRIFLASEEPEVIDEVREKYSHYEIINNAEVFQSANLSTQTARCTDASGYGILLDIYLLYLSDYVVCTFSSNVCRMVYELMQATDIDAINRCKSLDSIFYFALETKHYFEAIYNSTDSDKISMNVGDIINIKFTTNFDGYLYGKNMRTNQSGYFPYFKVIDKVETAEFPKYPNVE